MTIIIKTLLLAFSIAPLAFADIASNSLDLSNSEDERELSSLSLSEFTQGGVIEEEDEFYDGAKDDSSSLRGRRLNWKEGDPKVAWILGFPESGVNHMMNLIHQSSGMATATNYGHLLLQTDGKFARANHSEFVYDRGPVWYNLELEKPTDYVATLTRGTGYCLFCHPREYYYGNFWWKSSSGVYLDEQGKRKKLQYNPGDVKKVIHWIRDPFDNVVARFYSYIGLMRINRPDLNIEERFPLNETGFQLWCRVQDVGYAKVDLKWLPAELRELALNVPCRQEFIKIARFHSGAFLMARFREIEYKIFKYDDYPKDLAKAIRGVNEFIGYPTNTTDFRQRIRSDGIWNFDTFFTDQQRIDATKLLRNLSRPAMWFYLRDYTPDFYSGASPTTDPDEARINGGT